MPQPSQNDDHYPRRGKMVENPFCTTPQGHRICKDDEHTNACRTREMLCRNLVDWLRDTIASKQRAQIVRDFGELTAMDMMVGFSRWFAVRQMSMWQASDAESHMAISRGIPDLGSFIVALEFASRILAEEQFQTAFRQEGLR